jgi:DNA-binding NarL/FixJ family response regulator
VRRTGRPRTSRAHTEPEQGGEQAVVADEHDRAAVQEEGAGDALLAPEITQRLIAHYLATGPVAPADVDRPAALAALTPREVDVLRLVARGRSNREIAEELFVVEQTAKTHVSRVFAKLGLRDRAQAVVLAYETGLVRPGV